MIKSNELRTGNWVQPANKKILMGPFRIFSVIEHVRKCRSISGVNHQDVVPMQGEAFQIAEWSFESIDPVPLTEEWFKKMGFGNAMGWNYYINIEAEFLGETGIVGQQYDEGKFKAQLHDIDGGSVGRSLLYVHEVQNLYYALTGEEILKGIDGE